MFGKTFAVLKRVVALLCVAQALCVSAQANATIMDQTRHAIGMAHAPNTLAGVVLHHVGAADDHALDHHSTDDHDDEDSNSGAPLAHHHLGDGGLAPWGIAAPYTVEQVLRTVTGLPTEPESSDSAYVNRTERPPKSTLVAL